MVEATGIQPMYRKLVRELSKGYKQRTALAQALIHDPDVVILDEPTSGLDPHQILEIRQLISTLAKEKTVILSTHILQEVESTADRIVIINRGQIVGDGTVAELRARAKESERLLVSLAGDRQDLEKRLSGVEGVQRVQPMGEADGYHSFEIFSPAGRPVWQQVSTFAQQQQLPVRTLTEKPLTLEETFLRLTEQAAQAAKN